MRTVTTLVVPAIRRNYFQAVPGIGTLVSSWAYAAFTCEQSSVVDRPTQPYVWAIVCGLLCASMTTREYSKLTMCYTRIKVGTYLRARGIIVRLDTKEFQNFTGCEKEYGKALKFI